MLLKLYQAGQPILRSKAAPVKPNELKGPKVQDLIDFMIATLRDAPGVGLSAPQVGKALQICIIEDKASYHELVPKPLLLEQQRKPVGLKILINPTLQFIDKQRTYYFEGCLSIDGYVAVVPRYRSVKVSAFDRHGTPISFSAHGWQARILQHEADHLLGKLYIDAMLPNSFMTIKHFSLGWRKAQTSAIRKHFTI
jgi:peptide deformylase